MLVRLLIALIVLLPFCCATGAVESTYTAKGKAMMQERKKAAHRKRRIIFNNDGDDVVYECEEATAENLLAQRTTDLLGSQVDSIFYCTWSSGFGLFTHMTDVGERFTAKTGHFTTNLTKDFHDKGLDPLKIMVDFAKEHGLEIFWSMRMNDYHDGSTLYPEMFPRFKKEHPEYLFGTLENPPSGIKDSRSWAGVDYGRMEVRERAFRIIQEVAENYDVDGIELDFFRHLAFFKKHAWGTPCGQEERNMMTGLIGRVRRMTEDVALRRGRPLLIAVRVPDSVGYCEAIGLDITRWLEEDLVDILVAGGYFRLSPWESTVALGHKYDVPVYPSLDDSRMRNDDTKLRYSPECYRARAMEAWAAGVDGIYMYNAFNPRSPLWRELGDPRKLAALDKLYCVNVRSLWGVGAYLVGGERFINRPVLCPERPVTLKPGQPHVVVLPVGDDLQSQAVNGNVPEAKLRLRVENIQAPDDLSVRINGVVLTDGQLTDDWLEYAVPRVQVTKGTNRFEIALRPGTEGTAVVHDLQLAIHYAKGN